MVCVSQRWWAMLFMRPPGFVSFALLFVLLARVGVGCGLAKGITVNKYM